MAVLSPSYSVEAACETMEVFVTDIDSAAIGAAVKQALRRQLPLPRVSFDLDDRDRILRVQAPGGQGLRIKRLG